MRRILAPLALLCSLSVAWAEEPASEAAAKETLRQRLVAAMDAQPRIHHAMDWRIESEGEDATEIFVEVFRDADRAGLVAEGTALDSAHSVLFATDGRVIVMRKDDGPSAVRSAGARALNERSRPFDRAREALGKALSLPLGVPPYRAYFELHAEGGEDLHAAYGIKASRVVQGAAWLEAGFLDGKTLLLDASDAAAVVRGRDFEGRIRLADGLPVLWRTRGAGIRATVATLRWTEERWRAEIDAACANREPNFRVDWSDGSTTDVIEHVDLELAALVGSFATIPSAVWDDPERLPEVLGAAVQSTMEVEGLATVPPATSREAWTEAVERRARGIRRAMRLLPLRRGHEAAEREAIADQMVAILRKRTMLLWEYHAALAR